MKTLLRFASVIASFMALAACQVKELDKIETPDVSGDGPTLISVNASAPGDATKTSVSYNSETKTFDFNWKAGDQIQLLEFVYEYAPSSDGKEDGKGDEKGDGKGDDKGGDDYSGEFAVYGYSSELESDTDNATFQISMNPHSKPEGATYKYVGVYGGNFAGYQWKGSYPTVDVFLANWQSPTATSFDPQVDVLVSKLVELEERPSELSLQFARLGGIIKLNLSGLEPGSSIVSGELCNDEGFVTAYMIEYDPVLQKTVLDGEDKPTNSICFQYNDPLVADADGKATVWLRCVAGTISGWFQVSVALSDGKTLMSKFADVGAAKRTISFEDGNITEINVALDPTDVYAPEDVEATSGAGAIRVTWSAVANASGYICYEMNPYGREYGLIRVPYEYDEKEGKYVAVISEADSGIHFIKVMALGSEGHGADNRYAQTLYASVQRTDISITTGAAVRNGSCMEYSASVTGEDIDLSSAECFFMVHHLYNTTDALSDYGYYVEGTPSDLTWTGSDNRTLYWNTTYYYVAGLRIDGIEYLGDVRTFVVGDAPAPTMVNLGLPSGTQWANFNVGASDESDIGYYYAWGETTPKELFQGSGYSGGYAFGWRNNLTKYCTSAVAGTVDGKIVLEAEDDAATAMYGNNWRMPSLDEFRELAYNTTRTEDTVNNVAGLRFTSKIEGYTDKSIFIPYSGYRNYSSYDRHLSSYEGEMIFWTDQMYYERNILAEMDYYFDFSAMFAHFRLYNYDERTSGSETDTQSSIFKYCGLPIRAVSGGAGRQRPALRVQMGEVFDVTSTSASVNCQFFNLPVEYGNGKGYHTAYLYVSFDGKNWTQKSTLALENEHTVGGDVTAYSLQKTLSMANLTPGTTYYYRCGYSSTTDHYFTSSPFWVSVTKKFTTPAE